MSSTAHCSTVRRCLRISDYNISRARTQKQPKQDFEIGWGNPAFVLPSVLKEYRGRNLLERSENLKPQHFIIDFIEDNDEDNVTYIARQITTPLVPHIGEQLLETREGNESVLWVIKSVSYFLNQDEQLIMPNVSIWLKRFDEAVQAGPGTEQLAIHSDRLETTLTYSHNAMADVDFSLGTGTVAAGIIRELKSHDWHRQGPAVQGLLDLDWSEVISDEVFVLGRNVYQCACGNERKAVRLIEDLRAELAKLPDQVAIHFLNGMLYEVYFNCEAQFRGANELKGKYSAVLFSLQTAKKYEPSMLFIREKLQPYKAALPFLPHSAPETVSIDLVVKESDPPLVESLTTNGRNLVVNDQKDDIAVELWPPPYLSFTLEGLRERLASVLYIPLPQLRLCCTPKIDPHKRLQMEQGVRVRWPEGSEDGT